MAWVQEIRTKFEDARRRRQDDLSEYAQVNLMWLDNCYKEAARMVEMYVLILRKRHRTQRENNTDVAEHAGRAGRLAVARSEVARCMPRRRTTTLGRMPWRSTAWSWPRKRRPWPSTGRRWWRRAGTHVRRGGYGGTEARMAHADRGGMDAIGRAFRPREPPQSAAPIGQCSHDTAAVDLRECQHARAAVRGRVASATAPGSR